MGRHCRERVTTGWGCICAGIGRVGPGGQLGKRVMPVSMDFCLQLSGLSVMSLSNSSGEIKVPKQDNINSYTLFN